MKKLIILIFLGLLFHTDLIAQESQSVTTNPLNPKAALKGKIVDKSGIGIPSASISLYRNAVIVEKTLSNDYGFYQLTHSLEASQQYKLSFSSVGYKLSEISINLADSTVFKTIVMQDDQQLLTTVNVSGNKPLIERKTDRYIVNVENGSLSQGFTAYEVLQKSPGIWVSQDGSIRIKGNQSVMVMINDVVQRMSSDELAEYLKSLRSEDISKIEVIYNPPAEFEAAGAGGIIHIVLKKLRKDGLNGSVNSRYQQQDDKQLMSAGASIAYKVKRLYLSGNGSYTSDKNSASGRETVYYPDNSIFQNTTDRYNNISRYQYRIGAGYDISANHSIAIQNTGAFNQPVQLFLTDIVYERVIPLIGKARADWERKIDFNSTTLNYAWKLDSLGSSLKFIGDYSENGKNEQNTLSTTYTDPSKSSTSRTTTPSSTAIYAAQIDYTKAWKNKTEIKTGLKYTAVTRDNETVSENYVQDVWLSNPLLSNRFVYREQLLMAYATLEKALGNTNIKAGLRAEETFSDGKQISSGAQFNREYFGLFPSVYVMQTLDEAKGSAVFLNYSKRLQRPSFNDLNPYRLQVHDYTVLTGNPDLLPQYTHNIQVGYNFLRDYSIDAYYATTSNLIALLANTLDNNVVEYKSFNFRNGKEYGINMNASPTLTKVWTNNTSLSVYRFSTIANSLVNNKITLAARSTQTLSFKKIPVIDIIAEYKSPSVSGNTRLGHMFYVDLLFSRKVLKDKGAIRLYISDIFNTVRETEISTNNGTTIDYYQKRQTQNVSLSFSYNFSLGKKFNQSSIEQSNKEENRRMGN